MRKSERILVSSISQFFLTFDNKLDILTLSETLEKMKMTFVSWPFLGMIFLVLFSTFFEQGLSKKGNFCNLCGQIRIIGRSLDVQKKMFFIKKEKNWRTNQEFNFVHSLLEVEFRRRQQQFRVLGNLNPIRLEK